jgi:hypothetical protein
MLSIFSWFKRALSVGEPVYSLVFSDPDAYERELVLAIRRELCDRWWRSQGYVNQGRLSHAEFNRFALREKARWWRWNFGEEMP